jgi:hypothetical protein
VSDVTDFSFTYDSGPEQGARLLRKRLACPACGGGRIAAEYVRGVGGTKAVDVEDERGWYRLECGDPAAYVCLDCDHKAPAQAPFIAAGEEATRKEIAEREREASEARQHAEAELRPLAARLEGRTIVAAHFHAEDAPAGFECGPDIEAATLTLDDGSVLRLTAHGWHDIQSLAVDLSAE